MHPVTYEWNCFLKIGVKKILHLWKRLLIWQLERYDKRLLIWQLETQLFASSYIWLAYIFEASYCTLVTSVSKKSSVDQSELEKYVVSHFQTYYMESCKFLEEPSTGNIWRLDNNTWRIDHRSLWANLKSKISARMHDMVFHISLVRGQRLILTLSYLINKLSFISETNCY